MKRKAVLVTLLCVMVLAMATSVQATFFTCSIQQAGIHETGSVVLVYLTDINNPASVSTPFIVVGANQTATNGMYAAALTALSKGSNVFVDLSAFGPYQACITLLSQ